MRLGGGGEENGLLLLDRLQLHAQSIRNNLQGLLLKMLEITALCVIE